MMGLDVAALEIRELIIRRVERVTGARGVVEHWFAPPRRWRFDVALVNDILMRYATGETT